MCFFHTYSLLYSVVMCLYQFLPCIQNYYTYIVNLTQNYIAMLYGHAKKANLNKKKKNWCSVCVAQYLCSSESGCFLLVSSESWQGKADIWQDRKEGGRESTTHWRGERRNDRRLWGGRERERAQEARGGHVRGSAREKRWQKRWRLEKSIKTWLMMRLSLKMSETHGVRGGRHSRGGDEGGLNTTTTHTNVFLSLRRTSHWLHSFMETYSKLNDKTGNIYFFSCQQNPWKDQNQSFSSNFWLPYPACGSRPQTHFFILKT